MPPPITIRRARPGDAAALAITMGHEAVYPWLLQLPHPTAELWQKRLEAWPEGDHLLVAEVGGEVVGNIGLHAMANPRRRHCMNIGMAVHPKMQGQGVGAALLGATIDLADNWLQVMRLELGAYTDNTAAIALYKRFGFDEEGIARCDAFRGGRYVDTLKMARLHPRLKTTPAA